ncbi:MAG: hypothetical protein FIA97_01785, partial [Methylococcaceae bacterium]|nr:hypothetical protein [Methylococcaceae bacterium]
MKSKHLRRLIQSALSGAVIVAPASSAWASMTSYNTFNHDRSAPSASVSGSNTGSDSATDGWLRSTAATEYFSGHDANNNPTYSPTPVACQTDGSYCGDGVSTGNVSGAAVPWVGNDPRTDANFNYLGTHPLNWT